MKRHGYSIFENALSFIVIELVVILTVAGALLWTIARGVLAVFAPLMRLLELK